MHCPTHLQGASSSTTSHHPHLNSSSSSKIIKKKQVMGRGKIEIKMIESPTNRQVTYSKRRNGIFKKAQELTVLCDAKVSLVMFSSSGKLHEYISPSVTTKEMFDKYQKTMGIDLWSTHYERMQEDLRKSKEINNRLRREIKQRTGEDLSDVSFEEVRSLEDKVETAVQIIRQRKYHVIKTQTETRKKKVRNLEERQGNLLLELEARYDDPYGLVENERDYESAIAFANGASNLYSFRLHHIHHHHHLNLHDAAAAAATAAGFGAHELRLA